MDKGATTRRWSVAVLAVLAALSVVMLGSAVVYAAAETGQQAAVHAARLQSAESALRSVSLGRAYLGQLIFLSTSDEQLARAVDATRAAVVEATELTTRAVAEVQTLGGQSDEKLDLAVGRFSSLSDEITRLVDSGDPAAAAALAAESLDPAYEGAISALSEIQAIEAKSVNDLADGNGRIAAVTRFLVAFLVPAAAMVVYWLVSRRQQRTAELRSRLDTQHQITQAKDSFIVAVSHELRNPLTSITGFAEILRSEELPALSAEMAGLIVDESKHLKRLVEDLLTAARADAGRLNLEPADHDAATEVEAVVAGVSSSGKRIETEVEHALVHVDQTRLRQVLRNLVINAVRYGGNDIAVSGKALHKSYELMVADNGEGLPAELESRVFQQFMHEGLKPTMTGSVGLGLSIVRTLTEAMGGSVSYEHTDGQTRFRMLLPLAAVPSDA